MKSKMSLADIVDVVVDNRGKSVPLSDLSNQYLPLIATKNVGASLYPELIDTRPVDKETYDSFFRAHPLPGDILFVNKGKPGTTARVPNPVDFVMAQDMVALRAKPGFDQDYVFALLRSPRTLRMIDNMQVGTMIPHFKKTDFDKLILDVETDLEVQKKIGRLYMTFSNAVEQKSRINDNLLELGSTLWDKYFQFANADKQQSHLMDLGDIVAGGTPSKKNEAFYDGGTIPWITPKDLSNATDTIFINQGETSITEAGLSGSSAKLMPAGTVLFSSRAPIGYVAIANNPLTTNQGFKSIVPYDDSKTYYLYYLLKKLTPHIEAVAGGSTFKEISGSGMKSIEFPKPDDVSMSEFATLIQPMFRLIRENEQEIQRLTELRNVLLSNLLG